jgi:3-oxoadipate enol-lactonase
MPLAAAPVQHIEVEPGVRLAVSVSGAADKPAILFSNSLAAAIGTWDEVAERLAPYAHLIRYDTRGHGRSDAPPTGYGLDRLGADAVALLDALQIERAVVCGLSLGGLTGMWLGIHAAKRLAGLVLANTAPNFPPPALWLDRAKAARDGGVAQFVEPSLARWFTQRFRAAAPARVAEIAGIIAATSPVGYAGCCEVLAATDLSADLASISCPVRVIVGDQDPSTPPERGAEIIAAIPDTDLVTLAAAHLSAVEASDAFAAALIDFLPRLRGS